MDPNLISSVDLNLMQAQEARQAAALQPKKNAGQIEAAAEDFEAMFMAQMLAPMWEGVESDPYFGGGNAEETFRTFMTQEYGKVAAKSGDYGIAEQVKTELIRLQEIAHK